VAHIPDADEHRRRFAALPYADRRAIVRAVNQGRVVEKRKHAPFAVVIARRQQRLWRWGWLLGPAVGLVQLPQGWQVALVNALIGTVKLGLVARYFWSRATNAERANLALAEGRRKEAQSLSRGARTAPRGPRPRRGRG